MAIPNSQIGWGVEAKLLREIIKRLTQLTGQGSVVNVDFTDLINAIVAATGDVVNAVVAGYCCQECNNWSAGNVTSDSLSLPSSTVHSITIIVESGTVTLSNGTQTVSLIEGMSVTLTASQLLSEALTIDATNGSAAYVMIACSPITTTTTTEEVTTTTTTQLPD